MVMNSYNSSGHTVLKGVEHSTRLPPSSLSYTLDVNYLTLSSYSWLRDLFSHHTDHVLVQ